MSAFTRSVNDFSNKYTIKTKSSTTFQLINPSEVNPITNLQTTLITSTNIYISFTPPNTSGLNNYTLTLTHADINNISAFTILANKTTYELTTLLEQSPSLKGHFSQVFDRAFDTALKLVRLEYPGNTFPNVWQFSRDAKKVLNLNFWTSV